VVRKPHTDTYVMNPENSIGDPTLRQYDATSPAQRAITFLCLDFNGVSTRHNELPAKSCPSGIRAQIVRAFYSFLHLGGI
jgi:hypothetical protein